MRVTQIITIYRNAIYIILIYQYHKSMSQESIRIELFSLFIIFIQSNENKWDNTKIFTENAFNHLIILNMNFTDCQQLSHTLIYCCIALLLILNTSWFSPKQYGILQD